MPLRISNIRLPVEAPESAVEAALIRRLRVDASNLIGWRILRKSLDARSRGNLRFIYSAVVEMSEDDRRTEQLMRYANVERYDPPRFEEPEPGNQPLPDQPVIVGSGPAGMFAAYFLAERGYRPLVLERGRPVKERVPAVRAFDRGGELDHENNYLFGEGGAGCFSDGKLTCRLSGPDVNWVLDRFVECGGKPSLRYDHRPHLGSNRLPLICRNVRRKVEQMGGEYHFGCRVEKLDFADGGIRGLFTSSGYIKTTCVILAVGHSARDTYRMLHALGVPLRPKAFQLGLRIEQPQEQIDRHTYGSRQRADVLGAADYRLIARGRKDLFTFCMCAGGSVIPSVSETGMFCTNGMSNSRRETPFANSGLVVTLGVDEFGGSDPLAGMELQQRFESAAFHLAGSDYQCPIQRAGDFLADRTPNSASRIPCSYTRDTTPVNLSAVIPVSVVEAIRAGLPIMDAKWQGNFLRDAVLSGPEMRGSSPVRIVRDRDSRQTPGFIGLFPVGEGAGYAGGIVSAAVDGMRSAKCIVARFAPLEPARA